MGIQVVPAPRDELRAGWVCKEGAPPWWPFLPSARQEGFVPVVATWVGSPELPVPAHGHHDQQVAQDGHQDDGGDEGEQHDLLRDAEALTRTGSTQGDERERGEAAVALGGALGGVAQRCQPRALAVVAAAPVPAAVGPSREPFPSTAIPTHPTQQHPRLPRAG